jgi:hypothetical protein
MMQNQAPNRKHTYKICSLSNSIHLKNNYLQQGGKGNERVEGVPSFKKWYLKVLVAANVRNISSPENISTL